MIRDTEMQLALDKIEQLELKLESANSRILDLEDYIKQLEKWKTQQLIVELSWNPQKIAKLLDIPLGVSIHPHILPAIEKLHEQIRQLKNNKTENSKK